jgi:uncharacterized membrane protein YhaH (DUF805 family)
MNDYIGVLRNYAGFAGRARRREYWMFTLVSTTVTVLLTLLDLALPWAAWLPRPQLGGRSLAAELGVLGTTYTVLVLVPTIAVQVRRLHDTGRSGWWSLLWLVPVVGTVWVIVLSARDGDRGTNAHGPDPKAFLRPSATRGRLAAPGTA